MGVDNGIFYIFFKMMHGVFPTSALLHVFWVRFWSNLVVYRTLAALAHVCWIIKFIFKIPFQNIYFKYIFQIFSLRKWVFWQFWPLKKLYIYIYNLCQSCQGTMVSCAWSTLATGETSSLHYLIVHWWWGFASCNLNRSFNHEADEHGFSLMNFSKCWSWQGTMVFQSFSIHVLKLQGFILTWRITF
jgi:hypothetical protein